MTNLTCPNCKGHEFQVIAEVPVHMIRVLDLGSDGYNIDWDFNDEKIHWNDESLASCSCGWTGRLGDVGL